MIHVSLAKPMNGFQKIMTFNDKELFTNPLYSFCPHIIIHIYFYAKVAIRWLFKNIQRNISNIEITISILCSTETVLWKAIPLTILIFLASMWFVTFYTLAMNPITDNTHILLVFSMSCRKYTHRLHVWILDWWQL